MKIKEFRRVYIINSNSFDLKKIIKLQRPNNTHNKFPTPVVKLVKQKTLKYNVNIIRNSASNLTLFFAIIGKTGDNKRFRAEGYRLAS